MNGLLPVQSRGMLLVVKKDLYSGNKSFVHVGHYTESVWVESRESHQSKLVSSCVEDI